MIQKYKDTFPALGKFHCKCEGGNHSPTCGCLNLPFISKAHKNFSSILMEAQSQEEFVKRLEALPKHARDIHEWEGGGCDFHPLRVCSCKKCSDKQQIECEGKPYKTRMKLDCHCCMRLNAQRELHRPASWFIPSLNVATLMQLKPLTMY